MTRNPPNHSLILRISRYYHKSPSNRPLIGHLLLARSKQIFVLMFVELTEQKSYFNSLAQITTLYLLEEASYDLPQETQSTVGFMKQKYYIHI